MFGRGQYIEFANQVIGFLAIAMQRQPCPITLFVEIAVNIIMGGPDGLSFVVTKVG